MKQETRNKVNALVNEIEETIRVDVTAELTEKFTNRKKPGPAKGTPRKKKAVEGTPTDGQPAVGGGSEKPGPDTVPETPATPVTEEPPVETVPSTGGGVANG